MVAFGMFGDFFSGHPDFPGKVPSHLKMDNLPLRIEFSESDFKGFPSGAGIL
jgi:hypothetical protein